MVTCWAGSSEFFTGLTLYLMRIFTGDPSIARTARRPKNITILLVSFVRRERGHFKKVFPHCKDLWNLLKKVRFSLFVHNPKFLQEMMHVVIFGVFIFEKK